MPSSFDYDSTLTSSAHAPESTSGVPVLIVIGDALRLGASRKVLRIEESLEIGRRPIAQGPRAWTIDDDRVSRQHAVIEVDAVRGLARIEDLGSRNGTIVDGKTTRSSVAELGPGSLIFIGSFAAVFRFASESDLVAIAHELADPFTQVPTTSPELVRKAQTLRTLAKGSTDLLLVGETGVGKEEFARAIHRASGRPGKFVAINCPALPGSLIESELFGYVKGAHSQANRDKPGLIEEAERGTLFLDEFAEISPDMQAKLLRFLEERDFMALGATRRRQVDVRVLAATNRELSAIRPDIMARLGPEPIRIPPLSSHREDLAALAGHFLSDRPGLSLDVRAFQSLCLHSWPDNVRGLKKVMDRAAALAVAEDKKLIGVDHLPDWLGRRPSSLPPTSIKPSDFPSVPRRSPRAAPTKEELEKLLANNDWVVARVAREIDRDHSLVWRWIKRYGLDVPEQSE